MIKATLATYEKYTFIRFVCPYCKETHGIRAEEGEGKPSPDASCIWGFKIIKNNTLELHPSFKSFVCGYHSEYIWEVEYKQLPTGLLRTVKGEIWLHS
ncbi:MAG: hypothetical protein JKY15_01800 [Deltaproteobacteria bacterium]|nr:hypothetical protein [Deltaproteobacteria bacterium]